MSPRSGTPCRDVLLGSGRADALLCPSKHKGQVITHRTDGEGLEHLRQSHCRKATGPQNGPSFLRAAQGVSRGDLA